jgi:hypothetical protein
MTTNHQTLRELAEKAAPGPEHIYRHPSDHNNWQANAYFQAACDPETILALLDEMETLRVDAYRYRRLRENWIDSTEIALHGRLSVIDARVDELIDAASHAQGAPGMTLLFPFQALAESWRELAEQYDQAGLPQERDMSNAHADELTELLVKVVVDEEVLAALTRIYAVGYLSGHEDTVEGRYVDVVYADRSTYHRHALTIALSTSRSNDKGTEGV